MTETTHDDRPEGEPPPPRGRDDRSEPETEEDVDESSEMSFPASDPPAQGGTT